MSESVEHLQIHGDERGAGSEDLGTAPRRSVEGNGVRARAGGYTTREAPGSLAPTGNM